MERRHCLVTGANRGLGLEFVRQLLARGGRVVAACRHPGRASALNRLAGEHPGRLHVLPLDVAEPRQHAELVRELELVLDGARVDLLINNAGILHGGERFGEVRAEDLLAAFRTNTIGPFLLTQALAPLLADARAERPGAIVVNLSSRLGAIGLCREFRTPSYGMSKAALNMATAQLAGALAPRGVRVIAVSPGWVRTDMGGEQAPVAPEEAVAGLLTVIEHLPADATGLFRDLHGEIVPW